MISICASLSYAFNSTRQNCIVNWNYFIKRYVTGVNNKYIENIGLLVCKMKFYFIAWTLKTVFSWVASENTVFF
jgi:hypothetical protein